MHWSSNLMLISPSGCGQVYMEPSNFPGRLPKKHAMFRSMTLVLELDDGFKGSEMYFMSSKPTKPRHVTLDLRTQKTKGSVGSYGLALPVDGVGLGASKHLSWDQCGHYSGDWVSPGWWGVDLGSSQHVTQLTLYGRLDCCPERLQGVDVYLGNIWSNFSLNPKVATGINVQSQAPLQVPVDGHGRFLFVVREDGRLTVCEVEVVVLVPIADSGDYEAWSSENIRPGDGILMDASVPHAVAPLRGGRRTILLYWLHSESWLASAQRAYEAHVAGLTNFLFDGSKEESEARNTKLKTNLYAALEGVE